VERTPKLLIPKPPPPEEAGGTSLAIDLPLDAGPAWDALAKLDLNKHREDLIEETRRAGAKIEWSKSHREDTRYPDAKAREESAIATLVVKASLLADELEDAKPDAAHGKKFRRGRPRRAKSELTKAILCIRDNLRDNLKCFSLYAVLEVLGKREVVEELFEEGKIGITRVNVDLGRGRVYYRTRNGRERSVSFTRLDNIINDR
jgi:hypothetical protein